MNKLAFELGYKVAEEISHEGGHPFLGALAGGALGAMGGYALPHEPHYSTEDKLIRGGLGGTLGLAGAIPLAAKMHNPTLALGTLLGLPTLGATAGLASGYDYNTTPAEKVLAALLGGVGGGSIGAIAGSHIK
jgi:hypothetical protein